MPITISDRIQRTIDYMGQNPPNIDAALHEVCTALDITSWKYYKAQKSSKKLYQRFLDENMKTILLMGMGPGAPLTPDIKIPFQHKYVHSDADGYCTLKDVIYHVMHCGLKHDTGEDNNIIWNDRISMMLNAQKQLLLSLGFIWGFALIVIICPINKNEKIGERTWIEMLQLRYLINDLWGYCDFPRKAAESFFNIDFPEYNKLGITKS